MPTQITQTDGDNQTTLRVEGEMLLDDALVLEKIAAGIRAESGNSVTLDLSELDFLDSDSAAVLRRISGEGVTIEGIEFFLQTAVNSAEKQ